MELECSISDTGKYASVCEDLETASSNRTTDASEAQRRTITVFGNELYSMFRFGRSVEKL